MASIGVRTRVGSTLLIGIVPTPSSCSLIFSSSILLAVAISVIKVLDTMDFSRIVSIASSFR